MEAIPPACWAIDLRWPDTRDFFGFFGRRYFGVDPLCVVLMMTVQPARKSHSAFPELSRMKTKARGWS